MQNIHRMLMLTKDPFTLPAIQGQHLFTRYQTTEQLDARKHLNASAQ